MGVARGFLKKKSRIRPKKSRSDRKRRDKVHKKRAAALGVPETMLRTMTTMQIRNLLKRPLRTAKKFAKK